MILIDFYVLVSTMLNWKPKRPSMKVDLPSDCMPTTTSSGDSKLMLKLILMLINVALCLE
jgi:hypothetical protein